MTAICGSTSRTGHVSVCTRRDLGWACHPVPDERSALEEEIVRLQKDNAALKKDMLARGITPPGTPQAKVDPQSKDRQDGKQDGKSVRPMRKSTAPWPPPSASGGAWSK